MFEEDWQKEENRLEENILDAKLSREMAVINHAKEIQRKHALADELREEYQKLLDEASVRNAEERAFIEDRIQQIIEANKKIAQIRERLELEKHKIAGEIRDHRNKLFAEKAEHDANEMNAKKKLIASIRAFQRRALEERQFKQPEDLTTSAGHGLLDEMSIAELQERLSILREEFKRAEEERREKIHQLKNEREDLLNKTSQKINAFQLQVKEKRSSSAHRTTEKTVRKSERAKMLESRLAEARAQRSQLC
ncbi:unnamed protein product [Oikopleura dioica]|uniref:Uncharacterized protein n=1 Tax=Oikopleura dioica TaxID=34765 RepID=E4Y263_OIKDI|nr:unnamed protein product [Oikopleura dioica]